MAWTTNAPNFPQSCNLLLAEGFKPAPEPKHNFVSDGTIAIKAWK